MNEPKESKNIFNEIPKLGYSEPAAVCDAQAFEKVVRSRRSVRVYTSEKIPAEVVEKCLDLALLAPNSSNLQPWEFYWVKDAKKREAINHACMGQPAATTAAEIIVAVARTSTWDRNRRQILKSFEEAEAKGTKIPKSAWHYYRRIARIAYSTGPLSLLAPFKLLLNWGLRLKGPIPDFAKTRGDLQLWAVKTTALACENIMLSFRAFGYDTCPMEGLDPVRVKKILKLPCDAVVVMAISAGKRADNGVYGPQQRNPREQFIFKV